MDIRRLVAGAGASLSLACFSGCSGGNTGGGDKKGDEAKKDSGKDDSGKGGDDTPKKKTALMAGKAVVKGKVSFEGEMPNIKKMNEDLTKLIEEKAAAADRPHCLCKDKDCAGDNQQQMWHINPDTKGLANVVVFLVPDSDKFFACSADDEGVKKVADKELKVTQPFCAFRPHVGVLFPEYRDKNNKKQKTGEKLVVYNDTNKSSASGISHNTKWSGPDQPSDNKSVPPGTSVTVAGLEPNLKGPLSLQCSIHPWMNANVWILNHPYFAVTDEKGDFEIKNAPTGKVRIVVWHEGVDGNYLNKNGSKGEPITLKDGDNTQDYKASAPK